MTSTHPDARPKPPRAEPLQPDKPTSGDDQQPEDSADADSAGRLRKQSEDAVDNVREGYK